ncbi:hypothetical protein OSB04_un000567, partial [Centaurea solstitialis]
MEAYLFFSWMLMGFFFFLFDLLEFGNPALKSRSGLWGAVRDNRKGKEKMWRDVPRAQLTLLVLEALELKSTKSCEKVGKSAKSETEVLRVREVINLAPRSRLLRAKQPSLSQIPVKRSKV